MLVSNTSAAAMKLTTAVCISGMLLATTPVMARAAYSFDRYQVILDRKPFAREQPTPAPAPPPRVAPAAESFARNLRLSMITVTSDGSYMVGIVDERTRKSFILPDDEHEGGFEVVEVDYNRSQVVLGLKGELALIKMAASSSSPVPATAPVAPAQGATRAPSGAENRSVTVPPGHHDPRSDGAHEIVRAKRDRMMDPRDPLSRGYDARFAGREDDGRPGMPFRIDPRNRSGDTGRYHDPRMRRGDEVGSEVLDPRVKSGMQPARPGFPVRGDPANRLERPYRPDTPPHEPLNQRRRQRGDYPPR